MTGRASLNSSTWISNPDDDDAASAIQDQVVEIDSYDEDIHTAIDGSAGADDESFLVQQENAGGAGSYGANNPQGALDNSLVIDAQAKNMRLLLVTSFLNVIESMK
jgi:hypothetical protein